MSWVLYICGMLASMCVCLRFLYAWFASACVLCVLRTSGCVQGGRRKRDSCGIYQDMQDTDTTASGSSGTSINTKRHNSHRDDETSHRAYKVASCIEWLCCFHSSFLGCGHAICVMLSFLIILGPILLTVGIVMFAMSGVDPRDHRIATYNTAVEKWVGSYYNEFSKLKLTFGVDNSTGSTFMLDNVTTPDPIHDSGNNIRTYTEYLRYSYHGAICKTPTTNFTEKITVINMNSGNRTEVSATVYEATAMNEEAIDCAMKCGKATCYDPKHCKEVCENKRHGYWDDKDLKCYRVRYISSLCVKVQDDGTFKADDNQCYTTGSSSSPSDMYGEWQPDPAAVTPGATRDIPSITVVVRAASDPYIVLHDITHGSLKFGVTSSFFEKLGIIFVIVGSCFLALVVGFCGLSCMKGECKHYSEIDRRRHYREI